MIRRGVRVSRTIVGTIKLSKKDHGNTAKKSNVKTLQAQENFYSPFTYSHV